MVFKKRRTSNKHLNEVIGNAFLMTILSYNWNVFQSTLLFYAHFGCGHTPLAVGDMRQEAIKKQKSYAREKWFLCPLFPRLAHENTRFSAEINMDTGQIVLLFLRTLQNFHSSQNRPSQAP